MTSVMLRTHNLFEAKDWHWGMEYEKFLVIVPKSATVREGEGRQGFGNNGTNTMGVG
jgi:hypothetical protein